MALTRANGGALAVVTTGRALGFYTVTLANLHIASTAVDSDLEKIVRAIETVSTLEILGNAVVSTTGFSGLYGGNVRVALSGATPAAATTAGSLEGICNTAVAGTTVTSFAF